MDSLIVLFAAVVLIASVLASVAIWASPSMWVKVAALCLTAALLPITYASLVGLLGRPKPVTLEWAAARVSEATVIGASWQEDEAIYLWLRFDGSPEPRAYVLPWSRTKAQQLQGALRQANADGSSVRMRGLSDSGRDSNESVFYAEPQPTLPPKVPASGAKGAGADKLVTTLDPFAAAPPG